MEEMRQKTEKTMRVFEEYERRFAQAKIDRPFYRPWLAEEKEKILQSVKEVVCFRDDLIPSIRLIEEKEIPGAEGYSIRELCYETWPHFYGVSSLYCPAGGGKRPLIFICPGHSGRLGRSYQRAAIRFVRQGAYVLIMENIGQGIRQPFGHWNCEVPFACGLTVQGMILMETIALMRWAAELPFVDQTRLGACGLSGGGTMTCFLSALAPELTAIASCGYPSDFDFILQKEKKHCCCNLLPHICAKLEMWQIYGSFAPRHLILNQGEGDSLFPVDYFLRNVRKTAQAYEEAGCPEKFSFFVGKHGHAWDTDSYEALSAFFGRVLRLDSLTSREAAPEEIRPRDQEALTIPSDAVTTDQTAMTISGVQVSPDIRLQDIFPPMYQGKKLTPEEMTEKFTYYSATYQGDIMRILAQFEMSL